MENLKFKISINCTKEEYDILLQAIDYYNLASCRFEYGEHVETYEELHKRIVNSLELNRRDFQWMIFITKKLLALKIMLQLI